MFVATWLSVYCLQLELAFGLSVFVAIWLSLAASADAFRICRLKHLAIKSVFKEASYSFRYQSLHSCRMPSYYSKPVVEEVQALLDTPHSVKSTGATWLLIMKVFVREKIKIVTLPLHVRQVMPHPKNRNGSMLNGFNTRANASKVLKVGANRKELIGAIAIEMSPFQHTKDAQIKANVELAQRSKGLVVEPNGFEAYLSLGTSHMAAFCRSAHAGQRACFDNISDANKMISMEKLKADSEFAVMLEEGWDWDILPWQVEATWPILPEFA